MMSKRNDDESHIVSMSGSSAGEEQATRDADRLLEAARMENLRPRLVVVESPYFSPDKREMEKNIAYALECLRDSLLRGEAPFASHLLYTRVLDDRRAEERRFGLIAALQWVERSSCTGFYIDRGVSAGMRIGVQRALRRRSVEVRSLRGDTKTVARLQHAFDGRGGVLLDEDRCHHGLDSPLLLDNGELTGWRCGCGAVRTGPESMPQLA